MPYCVHCGKKLEGAAVCDCPEAQAERAAAAAKKPDFSAAVAKAAANPLVCDLLETFRSLFSGRCLVGLTEASQRTGLHWIVLLALELLAGTLSSAGLLTAAAAHSPLGDLTRYLGAAGFSFGGFFLWSLLATLLSLALLCGLAVLVPLLGKQPLRLMPALNTVSAALVPAAALQLAGLLLGLVWLPLGLLCLAAGFACAVLLLYFGLQTLRRFSSAPLWLYLGLFSAYGCAMTLLLYGIARHLLSALHLAF